MKKKVVTMKTGASSKFSYPAEMLPNNERTKVIMKAREEEQAAREATEKAVSTALTTPSYTFSSSAALI